MFCRFVLLLMYKNSLLICVSVLQVMSVLPQSFKLCLPFIVETSPAYLDMSVPLIFSTRFSVEILHPLDFKK